MKTELEPISIEESKELNRLESEVEVGRKSWITAGRALIAIRDKQLFRSDYADFWAYCAGRWGWKKRNAQYAIESVNAYDSLPEGMQNFARSASTAREMAKEIRKPISDRKPITDKVISHAPVVDVDPEPPRVTQDAALLNATGLTKERMAEIVSHSEPSVTLYYTELEQLWKVVKANATDKQLASFGVFAATLPGLVKEEKRNRASK